MSKKIGIVNANLINHPNLFFIPPQFSFHYFAHRFPLPDSLLNLTNEVLDAVSTSKATKLLLARILLLLQSTQLRILLPKTRLPPRHSTPPFQ